MKLTITKALTIELKGIAILMVIIGHVSQIFGASFLNYMGAFGVGIFLFISGYGLTLSFKSKGLDNFFKKRIVTVWIPYAIVTSVLILLAYFQGVTFDIKTNLLLILGFDYNRSIDPTMWYISFILLWYILFYIIFKCIKNTRIKALSFILCGVVFYKMHFPSILTDLSWQWKIHAFSFPLGVIVALYIKSGIKRQYLIISCVCTTFAMFHFYTHILESAGYYMLTNITTAVTLIIAVVVLRSCFNPLHFTKFIGIYSYELYLVEGYMISVVFHIIKEPVLAVIVYAILVIILAFLVHKFVKQLVDKILS